MSSSRQRLLDACEVLEALRPFVDAGDTRRKPFNDAWAVAFADAKKAAADYAAEFGEKP